MEDRYKLPAATMLAGLFVWLAFLALHLTVRPVAALAPWLGVVLCACVGGLVAFSGFRCRQVGGPTLGNIVRTGLSLVLSALSAWLFGWLAAGVLLVAACVTAALALVGPAECAVPERA